MNKRALRLVAVVVGLGAVLAWEPTALMAQKRAKSARSAKAAAKSSTTGGNSALSPVAPPITALAFLPDGKTLVVGTYQQAQFWNLERGLRTRTLEGAEDNICALALSPDGKTLAVGSGTPTLRGQVLLYDLATGKPKTALAQHTDVVYAVRYTTDGKRIVTASGDKTLRLWDAATGKPLQLLKDHADSVYGLACAPDGSRLVSTGVDRTIKVWEATTGKPMFTFTGRAHNDTAYALAFSPDGKRLLSASGDRTAKLWTLGTDPDNTREFRRLNGHQKAVHAATFSPDGLFIATASADGTVVLWSGLDGGYVRTLEGAKDWVYAVTFSPDSQQAVAGTYNGEALVWRVKDGRLEKTFMTNDKTARLVSAPDSQQKGNAKPAELVKVADGFEFPEGPAYDGKGAVYVSNCNSDYVSKLDGAGKALAHKRADDRFTFEKTNGMTFYEDGSLFVCDFGRKAVLLIHPDTRTELYADKCDDQGFKGPNDLAFDPEGNLYFTDPAGSDAKNPIGCVYRVAKGTRKVTRVAEGLAFPNGIAFSADAKTLYVAESMTFRILKAAVKPDGSLGKLELFCQMPQDHIPDGMNFDQAGNLYVGTVGPGLVTIIDTEGKITRTIKTPGSDVTNVEFAGKDLKTLYITEAKRGEVFKIQVEIGGLPLFRSPKNEAK